MSHSDLTAWHALRDAGLVDGDAPPESTQTPWYLQILLGVSAWIAAICLFGFLAVLVSDLLSSRPAMIVLGVACCAGAIALMRVASGEFFTQAAVPASVVGQVLIGLAAFDKGPGDGGGWFAVAFVAGAMYAFGPSWLHRFACGAALVAALSGIGGHLGPLASYATLPLFAWAAVLFWTGRAERYAPLAWACGLGALFGAATHGFLFGLWQAPPGIAVLNAWQSSMSAVAAMLLPAVALRLATAADALRSPSILLAIVGCMALAVLWLPAPGAAIGLAFVLTGFAIDRPAIVLVGVAGAIGCLWLYYYQLDVTLLDKSGQLAGGGALVLVLRGVARYLERRA